MKSTIYNLQLTIILWVLLAGMVLVCEIAHGRESFRHDPNVTCRQVVVDYTSHPLYGMDCNELPYWIEKYQGGNWVTEFAGFWLDCHPYGDPIARCDINFDGVTDLKDFALLSKCRCWYKTKTGTKYHRRGCTYLRSSCIPIQDARGLLPCAVCIIAEEFLK
jgi:hypothetical protein